MDRGKYVDTFRLGAESRGLRRGGRGKGRSFGPLAAGSPVANGKVGSGRGCLPARRSSCELDPRAQLWLLQLLEVAHLDVSASPGRAERWRRVELGTCEEDDVD